MARIDFDTITVREKKNRIHEAVPATYSILEQNGERYFQIDTYGQNGYGKKIAGRNSQVLQFSKDDIRKLIALLVKNDML